MTTPPHAICFDLDNTLWDVAPVIARAEARLQTWLEQHAPEIPRRWSIEAMREARVALASEQPASAHDMSWLRTEALLRHAIECGYDASVAGAGFEIFHAARHEVELYPDVEPALASLATRFRLLALTNGNADVGRAGLGAYFSIALTARDAGAAKPDARAYAGLVAATGLEPAQILHVGDDPVADIEGARAAGLRVAWLNRSRATWPAHLAPPALEVAELGALVQHLAAS